MAKLEEMYDEPDMEFFKTLDGVDVPLDKLYLEGAPPKFFLYDSTTETIMCPISATARNLEAYKVRAWWITKDTCEKNITGKPYPGYHKAALYELYDGDGTFLGFVKGSDTGQNKVIYQNLEYQFVAPEAI